MQKTQKEEGMESGVTNEKFSFLVSVRLLYTHKDRQTVQLFAKKGVADKSLA